MKHITRHDARRNASGPGGADRVPADGRRLCARAGQGYTTHVTCYLLHIMEDPDRDPYRDPDLKDVVGLAPRLFCAQCQPLVPLGISEAAKCMRRNEPCWKQGGACPPPASSEGIAGPYSF